MNGYELSRSWFDWAFENPDICTSNHHALFSWICEKWNRLGQKEKFGLPSDEAMEVLSIKSKSTFYKILNDLVTWKWVLLVSESKNQHTAKVIALNKKMIRHANGKRTALDTALMGHANGTVPIVEQDNNETNKQDNNTPQQVAFDDFWKLYNKSADKPACEKKWSKLKYEDQCKIMIHLPEYVKSTPDKKFRKNPQSYLNAKAWENEIISKNSSIEPVVREIKPNGYPNPYCYYSECWDKKIKPVRWENGDILSDIEIEAQYKLHKVGEYQYA